MTDVNIPLLRKAVEWAEAEAAKPDQRQSQWSQAFVFVDAKIADRDCGTCYCVAGWVASTVTGYPDPYDAPETEDVGVVGFAHQALGIPGDDDDWHELFAAWNGIADVRRIAEEIAGERL